MTRTDPITPVNTDSNTQKASTPISAKLICATFLLVVAVCWFVLMTFPVQSFDFYYHLAAGRWIAENHAVPTSDVFSTTARDSIWITHEWAVQLGMYLKYKTGGINFLLIMKSIWLTIAAVLLFFTGVRLGTSPGFAALIIAAAAPTVAFRAFLRPHVISYGLLVILVTILYGNLIPKKRSRLIGIAILFLVWANCHSGFVFGLFVLAVWQLNEFAGWYVSEDDTGEKNALTFLAPMGIAVAAALINPNFYHVFFYPFKFVANAELFGLVNELQPMLYSGFKGALFIPIALALMVLALVVSLLRLKQGSMRELVLLGVFGILAFRSVRNVPLAILVILPGMMLHGGAVLRNLKERFDNRFVNIGAFLLVLAVPVALTAMASGGGIPTDSDTKRQFGLGVKNLNYPSGAVEYLRKTDIDGNMFNTFAFGGYLLWELYPDPDVFIDGRLFVFMNGVIQDYRKVLSGKLSLTDLNKQYGVTHLVLAYPDGSSANTGGVYGTLKTVKDWYPVFWDDNSTVFAFNDGQNKGIVERDGYRILNPYCRTLKEIDSRIRTNPEQAVLEADRAIRTTLANSGAWIIKGRYHSLNNEYDEAIRCYDQALDQHPDNQFVRRQKALEMMKLGAYDTAEKEWKIIADTHGRTGYVLMNQGICRHRQGDGDAALKFYQQALQSGYQSAELMNATGICFAQKGDLERAVSYWQRGLKIDPDHLQMKRNLQRASRENKNASGLAGKKDRMQK